VRRLSECGAGNEEARGDDPPGAVPRPRDPARGSLGL